MASFSASWGHRPPYQVLMDSDIVADMTRFTMDINHTFEKTLGDKVKPLITQCSMRHLYARKDEPGIQAAIENAKGLERRRCGHHPDNYAEPLSTLDCLSSVVGPTNKHKYVVASNDADVRRAMRFIPGVPICYVSRSVCIMEPMSSGSAHVRAKEEREKFRAEILRPGGQKRKREEDDKDDDAEGNAQPEEAAVPEKKKSVKGSKGPNPLSMKKKKPKQALPQKKPKSTSPAAADENEGTEEPKKKRKRKHKINASAADLEASQAASGVSQPSVEA